MSTFSNLSSKTLPNIQGKRCTRILIAVLLVMTKIWPITQMSINREWLNTDMVLSWGGTARGHFGCNVSKLGKRETTDIWWTGAREAESLARQFCYLSKSADSVPIEKYCLTVRNTA